MKCPAHHSSVVPRMRRSLMLRATFASGRCSEGETSATITRTLFVGLAMIESTAIYCFVVSMILLFLLTQATQRWDVYEENYGLLFGLNTILAVFLLLVISWIGWRLVLRLRQKKFGSRLLIRLAAIFALVGILPGILIYAVSFQFVSRSIEVWFDNKVEVALDIERAVRGMIIIKPCAPCGERASAFHIDS